jgi:uncharacterized protein
MVSKSERFEMRVDEDILAGVDQWRAEQDDLPSRAEAMRTLVELGLSKSRDAVRFSDGEKLILLMLRDLYKYLKVPRSDINPDFIAEVIWGGHYWAPRWEMGGLFHGHEDDPQAVRFVVNVLDMWRFVEDSYTKLPKKDRALVDNEAELGAKFVGFDGNNEGAHMAIAGFLIEKMGRFSEFKGRDLNSHWPTVPRYARMLRVFEPMRAGLVGKGLSAEQLIAILKALTAGD